MRSGKAKAPTASPKAALVAGAAALLATGDWVGLGLVPPVAPEDGLGEAEPVDEPPEEAAEELLDGEPWLADGEADPVTAPADGEVAEEDP